MKFSITTTCCLFFLLLGTIQAQNVGIGTNNPALSAKLDIEAIDKGVLIPRISIPNLNGAAPVATPATSLLVYNTNTATGEGFHYWNGIQWVKLVDAVDQDWHEVGTTTAPNNINDNIFTHGNVGIGINNPSERLEIDSGGIQLNSEFGIGFSGEVPRLSNNSTIDAARIYFHLDGTTFGATSSFSDFLVIEKTDGNNNDPDGGILFVNQGSDNIREVDLAIKGNGRVGIGTINPDERLEVAGDIKFTGGDLKTEAMGKMTPLFVRGSGRNNPAATGRQIKLGNDILPINNGRGLNLTVINASTHTLVSNTTYDTYIGTVGVNGLVNALRNATRDNIYILTSRDAWEPSVNNNLRFQARRLGLFKLAGMKINNYGISQGRFPYVAIFRGAGTGTNNSQVNRHVLEVIGTEATGGPQGLDVGVWLMDGGFSGGGVPTALVSPDPDRREAVVFVTSDNRVGINTFAPTQTLSVSGSAGKTGGGNWATFSDARVKKNIMPYKDGLAEVLQIAPKTFQYNGKGGYEEDGKTYYGVIAQEIEQIAPYTVSQVTTRDFEDQRLYDGTALTYMLINAVQEQQQIIERLEEKITAIEQQNASLLSQHSNKKQ